jgi:octaprenyl-diphosphate synthase
MGRIIFPFFCRICAITLFSKRLELERVLSKSFLKSSNSSEIGDFINDDVVDESTERRGQLSVNAIFNNKVAVLAGDYLLATALVQVGMTRNHDIIDIVSCLGQDLADGELLQLSNVSNLHFSEEVYFDVIRKKTAVLFAACTKAGALSVGASDEKAESARLFGEYIGLCFQIKDDIFDYSESKEIGKPTGNDMVEGKLTLPALHVLNTVKDKTAEEIAVKIKNGYGSCPLAPTLLQADNRLPVRLLYY